MKSFLARLVLLLAFLVPAAGAAETPPKADGFTFVKSAGGISEYTLDANKLSVLLKEDHSAPVLTFMVTYRVGSRNEVTGTTGATHLLEHLMFKGSEHYNNDLGTGFDTVLDKIGASNNATTSLDRTDYYEDLPSDHLELAVQIESDRIRGLLLRESDRAPEMTVVRNEFERGENDPVEALDKEISAAAYIAHPYHHPTIGWRSDIEKVSIEKLRAFYDTFYWPNNATVTIIGDFNSAAALGLLKKYYGPISAAPHPLPEVYTEEPAQQGPRRVTVKRPGELGVVGIAYKVPPGLHADHAALVVLGDILTDGKTSRLYRALIDQNLAVSADCYVGFNRDASLLNLYIRLAPGTTHAQAEKIVLDEIEKLKSGGATPDEVARAVSKESASTAYGRDGSFAIASQINEDIAVGDWTAYLTMPEKIQAVTAADVNRVAKTYLIEDQSTTGWFIPVTEGGEKPGPAAAQRSAVKQPNFYRNPAGSEDGSRRTEDGIQGAVGPAAASASGGGGAGSGALIAPQVNRARVAGIDRILFKTSLQDVVTIRGSLPAGDVFNPANHPALADLTAGLLDKGTAKHDKFALAGMLEDVGASISFDSTPQNLVFSAKCLRKDIPLVLGLLAEQLRTPAFSADELEKLKKQAVGEYQEQLDDTNFRASQALGRALFPAGHPNHPAEADRYLADIAAVGIDDIRAFHAAHYGPAAMVFVAVGDVDPSAIDAALTSAFAGWTGGTPLPAAAAATPPAAARTEKIAMPGKASVSVLIGLPDGLKYSDPDRIALAAATEVFGGGYFSSRLLAIVRAKEGLTYGIYARLRNDTYTDGQWAIQATFAPALLDKGLASTQRELKRFTAEGVTADELRDFKNAIIGSYKLALATSGGIAGQLLTTVQRGLPLDAIDTYPRQVDALTLAEVNAAVKKYLDPNRMVTVLAGTLPDAAK
ncbi:MAG TPA: pitrilysin family protein [Opitutaceae bacterium]|nr:pitrilysin family protein [Opitutaceae bacterium]